MGYIFQRESRNNLHLLNLPLILFVNDEKLVVDTFDHNSIPVIGLSYGVNTVGTEARFTTIAVDVYPGLVGLVLCRLKRRRSWRSTTKQNTKYEYTKSHFVP